LGRDLRAAILVGVALGAVILASLFLVRQLFIAVVAASVLLATWEVVGALRRGGGIQVALIPALVGGQAMLWLSWPFGVTGVLSAAAVTMLVCLLWRMRQGRTVFARRQRLPVHVAYVPFFAAFACMLVLPSDGAGRCSPGCSAWWPRMWAASPPGWWPGGTRWLPRSAPEIVGGLRRLDGRRHGGRRAVCGRPAAGHWWLGVPLGAVLVAVAPPGT